MSADKFSNPVIRWIDHRLPVFSMLDHTASEYPTPKNLSYMWNFGSLAGLSLGMPPHDPAVGHATFSIFSNS